MPERDAPGRSGLRRMRSACALCGAVVCILVGLVAASVVGNDVNAALPRGFGLVGIVVTVGLVMTVLIVLISPKRLWHSTRGRRTSV